MVNSKHQKLTPEEIIDIASQNTGSEYSPEQVRAAIMVEVRMPNTLAIQEGNTLFIVHRDDEDPGVAVFRALNADTAQNYLENSMVFTKLMHQFKFDTMVSTFYDPTILNIFQYISMNPPFPNMGYQVEILEDDEFQVTVNLGTNSGLDSVKRKK